MEADRIIKFRGRIEVAKDKNGEDIWPLRIWHKNEQTPGLNMTRSFGKSALSYKYTSPFNDNNNIYDY